MFDSHLCASGSVGFEHSSRGAAESEEGRECWAFNVHRNRIRFIRDGKEEQGYVPLCAISVMSCAGKGRRHFTGRASVEDTTIGKQIGRGGGGWGVRGPGKEAWGWGWG